MTTRADDRSGRSDLAGTRPVRRGRAANEARLREAALLVLERDGVLAGLALHEVAREAGVTQALVNRYFGSRRALLRAALAFKRRDYLEQFRAERPQPMSHQAIWSLRGAIRHPQWARVMALLALDGDDQLEPLDRFDEAVGDARAAIAAGDLARDFDPEATQAVFTALSLGWSLLREATARQTGIPTNELDDRAEEVIVRMLGVFLPHRRGSKRSRRSR